jgi:hypothetical protein
MKDFGEDLFSQGFESTGKEMTVPSKASGSAAASAAPSTYVACYETHPKLVIGGGTLVGGSCSCPKEKHAHVYVGLDHSMKTHKSWPWLPQKKNPPVDVHYPITDYQAPSDSGSFIAMVAWLCTQLQKGKVVHVGCIGGHGRTGTVFSAIVAVLEKQGKLDLGKYKGNAIEWVRKHYCKKAVESKEQVDFLNKHFGTKKVKEAKTFETYGKYSYGAYDSKYTDSTTSMSSVGSIAPVRGSRLIWEKVVPK